MPVPALLSVEQMYRADAAAIAGGVPGLDLMEAAGTAIADAIRRRWSRRPLVVLCGPGSNGGDGFVVARLLAASGWPVRVALAGERRRLKGDAAVNAERWHGDVVPLSVAALDGARLVIDALFGAGLARPIEGTARAVVEGINARRLHCVAVDTPSGVHGDSGAIMGDAPKARLTVTFFRPKPGHFLLPGRLHRGDLVVADIGIPEEVLDVIRPQTFVNGPALWAGRLPRPSADDNKYTRGHALVVGGEMTGAARLAARGARRVGAGLVTVACAPELRAIYGSDWPGTIVTPVADDAEFATVLADSRKNAVLIGPGTGVSAWTRRRVLTILETGKRVVLDADALTVFEADPGSLFQAIRSPCLLTPHEGEYRRLFAADGDKVTRARGAARVSGAVVLLKGGDTVIAAPDGRAAIEAAAPAELATAGSGDVLAGMALGLLAQGMDPFDAGCAAAWLHGQAALAFGPGLIAEDLADLLPAVFASLGEHGRPWRTSP